MKKMALNGKRIDVWRVKLNLDDFDMNVLKCILSDDEQNRANSYKFFQPRKLFILARVRLRQILSLYTDLLPERLVFSYSPQGKPNLVNSGGNGNITFNMSHSGEISVYAVSLNRNIGIDIEKPDKKVDFESLAKKYFSSGEYETIMELPEGEKQKAFYRCWTRKEAYIKGKGTGIAQLLDKVAVSCAPGEPAGLLSNRQEPEDVQKWSIEDLKEEAPYIGALAYEGKGAEIRYFTY